MNSYSYVMQQRSDENALKIEPFRDILSHSLSEMFSQLVFLFSPEIVQLFVKKIMTIIREGIF